MDLRAALLASNLTLTARTTTTAPKEATINWKTSGKMDVKGLLRRVCDDFYPSADGSWLVTLSLERHAGGSIVTTMWDTN